MINDFMTDKRLEQEVYLAIANCAMNSHRNMIDKLGDEFKSGEPLVLKPKPKEEQDLELAKIDIFRSRLLEESDSKPFGWSVFHRTKTYKSHFKKLKAHGYRLLNKEDYPDYRGALWQNLENEYILFRDVEFHQAYACEDERGTLIKILVRHYKIKKSGLIKMKQSIFSEPAHLTLPLDSLVNYAGFKEYNIIVTADQYDKIIIPYNAKGMLSSCEFQCLKFEYSNAGKYCLSGDYTGSMENRRAYIRKVFLDATGEEMTNFFTYDPPQWKPTYHRPMEYISDNTYIKENTYYD